MRTVTNEELATELTPYDEALDIALSLVKSLPPVRVRLPAANNRVAAETVRAAINVPSFDNSSMDGWAVDTTAFSNGSTEIFEKIATGAPLPDRFDAVVPWERVELRDGRLHASVVAGANIRRAGHDIAVGNVIVREGELLNPFHLAAVAACGLSAIDVVARPRVGLLISGGELAAPEEELSSGQVFDSNSTLLPALLSRHGIEDVEVVRVLDDEQQSVDALRLLAAHSDLVITTGGASVGERDWIRPALATLGEIAVWRVGLRPGKPFAAGRIGTTPILSLPGNPGSVAACFHVFVSRVVRAMSGSPAAPTTRMVKLAAAIENPGNRVFICPIVDDGGTATIVSGSNSQAISHLAQATGYLIVAPTTTIAAETVVEIELI